MFTDEAIQEYLESEGVNFKTKDIFKDPEELAKLNNKDVGTGNEGMLNNKSADAAQSRQRQDNLEISKANKKQIIANSTKFDRYPYKM